MLLKKLVFSALLLIAAFTSVNAQCPKGVANGVPYDAAGLAVGIRTEMFQTVWGNEYLTINNVIPGATYRIDLCEQLFGNITDDMNLTVYEATSTNVLGFNDDFCGDDPQVDFVIPVGITDLHAQINVGPGCGANASNHAMHITLISAPATCTDPDVPTPTASVSPVCLGGSSTLDWTGDALNDATLWHIYTTSCGVGQIGATASNTLIVNPLVTTTYYIRGEDGAGCVDESTGLCGSVTVVVSDAVNPTITCPANQNEVIDATCNLALPDYTGSSIAADNCGAVTVTQSPVAGTIVGVGTTNVTLTATDGSANTANCNFDVIVTDGTNPTITCPANQNEVVDATCNLALPDYTGSAIVADNCGAVTVTQSPVAGTIVGVGTTNVTLTATDGASNTASCNFDVIATDGTNPTITCPANQNEIVDATCNLALPDYTGSAIVADNCGAVTVTQSPVAGTIVGVGTTNVTLTATDGGSNTASCNFDVIVTDGTNPTITCPVDQNEPVNASCQFTLADYTGLAVVADNCNPAPAVTQLPVAGTIITGATVVTLTVDDGNGNTASCNFNAIGIDNINPTITCPANQNESFDATCNFTLPDYTGLSAVADNCNPAPAVTQSPVAGTVISGTTTITLTADDGSGNTASCTFDVIPA
ncbi:MAG: HYR domain-containing protein, partial [Flavobacteriales bacterium]|nr:HYR domain-containing protein [Flavobacteriales bacterium]